MATDVKTVEMICPKCQKREMTALDYDDPAQTFWIELACPACLDADDTLIAEPIYRDQHGMQIALPARR